MKVLADKFFALIADHGRFQPCQLYRYVELQTGEKLLEWQQRELMTYAESLGAKRESGAAPVYRLPTKMRTRRGTAGVKRASKAARDMFGGR